MYEKSDLCFLQNQVFLWFSQVLKFQRTKETKICFLC